MIFELEWSAKGKATIEADTAEEAESILSEGVEEMSTIMFEAFDVVDVTIESNEVLDG